MALSQQARAKIQAAKRSTSEGLGIRFDLTLSASLSAEPITGRLFVIITKSGASEPRMQLFDVPLFGVDVFSLCAGVPVIIDANTPGYPISTLAEIPVGDYYVQALLNVYTEFHRSDGHTVWAHMDHWEGQDMARSPGNLRSKVAKLYLDPRSDRVFKLMLERVIPPIEVPADTEWVKRIRFQSKLLTEFWGHPIYLGATILLPRGYDDDFDVRYPVVYVQGHFSLDAPFGFKTDPDARDSKSWARSKAEYTARGLHMAEPPPNAQFNGALYNGESGYEFYESWKSEGFPPVIAVTFQHPTPYFDASYCVNSASIGPYGDAIMNELIPLIEERFRVISEPYARVLTGCSTGGWAALALQMYHPEFFGGTWAFCPDPVDFRRYYGGVNLYEHRNAFSAVEAGNAWVTPERYCFRDPSGQVRLSNRQFSRLTSVAGTQDAGYAWVSYTPVAADGYPTPVWDLQTGEIDYDVVKYMNEHGYDLRAYLERNWMKIGPALIGKLHLFCGDSDGGFFNLALYFFEDFLNNTHDPYFRGTFTYGRPLKGHGWQPMTAAELVVTMAQHIEAHAPAGTK